MIHFVTPPEPARLAGRLTAGEAHVWRARAEAMAEPLDSRCLDTGELRRAARLRMPGRREAFVFAHSLQRQVLARYVGVAATDLRFEIEAGGKPAMRGGLQFNLTHCGGAALLVISSRFPVGIDLEDCGRKIDLESLARACLSDSDLDRFEGVPMAQRHASLLQWWTRKEAMLKAEGCGLARDPRELEVCWPATPLALNCLPFQGRRWLVADLALGDRWRAAVSIEGQPHRIHGFCLGW